MKTKVPCFGSRREPPRVISTSRWSWLSGVADQPEKYYVVTYQLTESRKQATLTLTQSNSPVQQVADNLLPHGWQPLLHARKQLAERPQERMKGRAGNGNSDIHRWHEHRL
jgi:hypothetical protein